MAARLRLTSSLSVERRLTADRIWQCGGGLIFDGEAILQTTNGHDTFYIYAKHASLRTFENLLNDLKYAIAEGNFRRTEANDKYESIGMAGWVRDSGSC